MSLQAQKTAAFVELASATIQDLHETVRINERVKEAAAKSAAETVKYIREHKLLDERTLPEVEVKMASFDQSVELNRVLFAKLAEQMKTIHALKQAAAQAGPGAPADIPGRSAPGQETPGDVVRRYINK